MPRMDNEAGGENLELEQVLEKLLLSHQVVEMSEDEGLEAEEGEVIGKATQASREMEALIDFAVTYKVLVLEAGMKVVEGVMSQPR